MFSLLRCEIYNISSVISSFAVLLKDKGQIWTFCLELVVEDLITEFMRCLLCSYCSHDEFTGSSGTL